MLNEVMIVPRSVYDRDNSLRLTIFRPGHRIVDTMPDEKFPFVFDFTTLFQNDLRGTVKASIIVPILALDTDKLKYRCRPSAGKNAAGAPDGDGLGQP